LDIPTHKETD